MSDVKYILGIQGWSNRDSGACIVKASTDGTVLDYAAVSEERLIRVKYPYVFPLHSLGWCMDYFGLRSLDEIDLLVTDYTRIKRWFNSGPGYHVNEFDYLKIKLDLDPRRIKVIRHHDAHAAAAYYASGFDDAAILVVDGHGSDLETTSYFLGRGFQLEFLERHRHHGIGACYAAVTVDILNLGTGGEGKTMGLAPYGAPHPQALEINRKVGGIKTDFSPFMRRLSYSDVLNQKYPDQRIKPIKIPYQTATDKHELLNPYFSRVAYDLQKTSEEVLLHLARDLQNKTGQRNLCISGGVGLNSVSNKIILDQAGFKNVFILPACGDGGLPFGLALWGYYHAKELGDFPRRKVVFTNDYTGPEYDDAYIRDVFTRHQIPHEPLDLTQAAAAIAEGKIVGWVQGRSEYGPRALGHRSILADSRNKDMKDILNLRVKHREPFRPFAPSILREHASEYFDLEGDSPYMLLIADVKKPDVIPAVTHIDNSARIQTVTKEDNDLFYDLIQAFYKLTEVPCILNTSFNDAGEPIVETPEDAILCFLKSETDYLVIGRWTLAASKMEKARLVPALEQERTARLAQRRTELIRRFCTDYDERERDHFLEESNKMAEWYAKYRAKYELEKMTNVWTEAQTRILIVGTPDHTAILPKVINQFGDLNIVGFIRYQDSYDRDPQASQPYPEYPLEALQTLGYDVILVSSWEYNFEIEAEFKRRGLGERLYVIYDNVSRSFFDTLSRFPAFQYEGLTLPQKDRPLRDGRVKWPLGSPGSPGTASPRRERIRGHGSIPSAGPSITEKEVQLVADAARHGWYENMRSYIDDFESSFSDYTGMKYCLATNTCTAALHLAFLSLGIGPGDEVVVPDITWVASAAPICYTGATPVFADIDPKSLCLSAESFERAITPRTKAVVMVDLVGNMPDVEQIGSIASQHNIVVVEDAAESIGAEFRGRKAGTLGKVGVYSFNGTKLLVTGQGGMVVTNEEELYERLKRLYHHGIIRRPGERYYWSHELGYNYQITNLQAALGVAQLSRIEELVESRRRLFRWYQERLKGVEGIQLNQERDGTKSTFWLVTAFVSGNYGLVKEEMVDKFHEHNIDVRPFFYPLSSMPPFSVYCSSRDMRKVNPVSYNLSPYGICLPSAFSLTESDVDFVCKIFRDVLEQARGVANTA